MVGTELLHVHLVIGTDKHVDTDVSADVRTSFLGQINHILEDARINLRNSGAQIHTLDWERLLGTSNEVNFMAFATLLFRGANWCKASARKIAVIMM
jgi:hypothetical protein